MATGRVLQFDQARGYGFVAADDGGEDVFLHASVFDGDAAELAPGMLIAFKVMAGDRGRKAFAAHLADDDGASGGSPAPVVARVVAGAAVQHEDEPALGTHAVSPVTQASDDEQMCDVLSATELASELTEQLLHTTPELTGQQILHVRQTVLDIAKSHGWIDG